ncbi:MAG: ABC transporter substrate-binding protein, partial [Thermodesulfobacteriota bacterium]|nr:ABC transporter substrate-binding protein [Thermodesulfobacteriota bacterium]
IKAKAAKAQVIVPFTSLPETAIMAKQLYDMKVPALMAGYLTPTISMNAWKTLEGKVEWIINFCGEIGSLPTSKLPGTVEFFEKLTKGLGHMTDADKTASSYDSIYVLKEAIERAGTLKVERIIEELEKTNYVGVNGRYKFGKDHQIIYGTNPEETCIGGAFQWVNGKRVVFSPKAVAEGKVQLPPWMR